MTGMWTTDGRLLLMMPAGARDWGMPRGVLKAPRPRAVDFLVVERERSEDIDSVVVRTLSGTGGRRECGTKVPLERLGSPAHESVTIRFVSDASIQVRISTLNSCLSPLARYW